MLGRINNFKIDLEQKYDNRLNPNSQRTVEIKLTIEERIKALVLEVIAVLGVIFSLGNQGWKNVAKELFAEVRTGVVFHSRLPDLNNSKPDEQIAKIATALNAVDVDHTFGINEAHITKFIARGGLIQLLEDGQQIPLRRDGQYIVGCFSGVNRSQTHAAYMIRHKLTVNAILAGGDSAFNPTVESAEIIGLYSNEDDKQAFRNHFRFDKRPQLGSECNNGNQMDSSTGQISKEVRDYFTNYINGLEPTHFIAYSTCGPSILKRLLDSNKPSLEGFTLTIVDWKDQILNPPEGVAASSQEAYQLFETKIAAHFPIVDDVVS